MFPQGKSALGGEKNQLLARLNGLASTTPLPRISRLALPKLALSPTLDEA